MVAIHFTCKCIIIRRCVGKKQLFCDLKHRFVCRGFQVYCFLRWLFISFSFPTLYSKSSVVAFFLHLAVTNCKRNLAYISTLGVGLVIFMLIGLALQKFFTALLNTFFLHVHHRGLHTLILVTMGTCCARMLTAWDQLFF